MTIAGFPSSAAGGRTGASTLTLPRLRAVNTFHSDGTAGIVLDVPRKVKWMSDNIEIELGKGTDIAMVGVRNHRADAELCELCFLGTFAQTSRRGPYSNLKLAGACSNDAGQEVGCTIYDGRSEVYFLADGPFKVTMKFPELRGGLKLPVSGDVDGMVERVPAKCLTPDCAVVSGSVVRTIGRGGRPSYAQIQTSVWGVRSQFNPTAQWLTACAYPGFFNEKSPNPADHPYGCDFDDPKDPAFSYMTEPFVTFGGGLGDSAVSGKTHGRQYLGYTIHHREAIPPTKVEAFALWLTAGIRCPSGNFFAC